MCAKAQPSLDAHTSANENAGKKKKHSKANLINVQAHFPEDGNSLDISG